MKVTLTCATGFIGSHVLTELLGHRHEATARFAAIQNKESRYAN